MEDCNESLVDATGFYLLNSICGYSKIPLEEGYKDKTTFTYHSDTYRFNWMSFGPMTASSTL